MSLPKTLTVAYLTARKEPKIQWFLESLKAIKGPPVRVIIVDFGSAEEAIIPPGDWCEDVEWIGPKHSVWQGSKRLTKDHWWDKSGYINTAIALCKTEWISFLDDRCVVMPGYFDAIVDAMKGEYVVAGKYEKQYDVLVKDGRWEAGKQPQDERGNFIGKDPRSVGANAPRRIPGEQLFGCNYACPVEWLLQVNGSDESTSPTGLEDCILGMMLSRNNYPIMYDERMFIIEDRTPGQIDSFTKRCDKGPSPHDRSHAILKRTHGKLAATHPLNLRELRAIIQNGEPFPVPSEPSVDWFDRQPLSEFHEYH